MGGGGWWLFWAFLSLVGFSCLSAEVPQVLLSTDAAGFEGLAAALGSLASSSVGVEVTLVTPFEDAARARKLAECVGIKRARVVPWEATNVTRLATVKAKDLSDKKAKKAWTGYRRELASVLNFVRFYLADIVEGRGPTLYLDSDVVLRCDVAKFLKSCRQKFANSNATILVAPRSESDNNKSLNKTLFAQKTARTDALNKSLNKSLNKTLQKSLEKTFEKTGLRTKERRRRRRLSGHVLEDHEQLFNAGVFVADLERWRDRNATGRLEDMFLEVANMVSVNFSAAAWHRPSSQAPMTRVFGEAKDYAYLEKAHGWNHRMKMKSRHPGGDSACLWHFVGAAKPWHVLEKHIRRDHKEPDLQPDLALLSINDTHSQLKDLPWWVTVWLPYARPCCVDHDSLLCKWHQALSAKDRQILDAPRPTWPKDLEANLLEAEKKSTFLRNKKNNPHRHHHRHNH